MSRLETVRGGVWIFVVSITAVCCYREPVSFESYNIRGKYIEVNDYDEAVLGGQAGLYYIRPGLTEEADTVSLEREADKGYYLRHANFLVDSEHLKDHRNPKTFKADATFKCVRRFFPKAVSFESVNFPNHFLRHQNNRVKLAKDDGSDLFKADAAWFVPARSEVYVLLDVTGSMKSTKANKYLPQEVEIIQALFDYLTSAEKKVFDKVGSVAFIPFDTRLLTHEQSGFAVFEYENPGLLKADKEGSFKQFCDELLARKPNKLTNIGKVLEEVEKMSGCLTNTAVILISDFFNIHKEPNPMDGLSSMTKKNVKVYPIILDAEHRSDELFNKVKAETVDKVGYDIRNKITTDTFKEIFSKITA